MEKTMTQNEIIAKKELIKEFFTPTEVNLNEIDYLYLEIDNETKTAVFSLNFAYPNYYWNFIHYEKTFKLTQQLENEMRDLVYPEEMESEKEDSYEMMLQFMQRHELLYHYIKRWHREDNYIGDDLSEYYEIAGHHRDSSILEESNYQYIKNQFEEDEILIGHFNHWAIGWTESIFIKEDQLVQLEKADEILERYHDYPVLDEYDYQERQLEEMLKTRKMILDDFKEEFTWEYKTRKQKRKYAMRMWQIRLVTTRQDEIEEKTEERAWEYAGEL
jgi:hypothetical protein